MIKSFAEEDNGTLGRRVGKHRLLVAHHPLEKARVQFVQIAAEHDEEVCAIASLSQRRHYPAARLQNPEISVLPFAQSVIDDATCLIGNRHNGPHALNVGAKTAEYGEAGFFDERRCCGDGLG